MKTAEQQAPARPRATSADYRHMTSQQGEAYLDQRDREYERAEFTSGELLKFLEMPVGMLADVFYGFIDLDPGMRFARTRQLKKIIRQPGLVLPERGEACGDQCRDGLLKFIKAAEAAQEASEDWEVGPEGKPN